MSSRYAAASSTHALRIQRNALHSTLLRQKNRTARIRYRLQIREDAYTAVKWHWEQAQYEGVENEEFRVRNVDSATSSPEGSRDDEPVPNAHDPITPDTSVDGHGDDYSMPQRPKDSPPASHPLPFLCAVESGQSHRKKNLKVRHQIKILRDRLEESLRGEAVIAEELGEIASRLSEIDHLAGLKAANALQCALSAGDLIPMSEEEAVGHIYSHELLCPVPHRLREEWHPEVTMRVTREADGEVKERFAFFQRTRRGMMGRRSYSSSAIDGLG